MESLRQENTQLKQQLDGAARAYEELKQCALKAYYEQKARIAELEKMIENYRAV